MILKQIKIINLVPITCRSQKDKVLIKKDLKNSKLKIILPYSD